jgi:hypothetical protein
MNKPMTREQMKRYAMACHEWATTGKSFYQAFTVEQGVSPELVCMGPARWWTWGISQVVCDQYMVLASLLMSEAHR